MVWEDITDKLFVRVAQALNFTLERSLGGYLMSKGNKKRFGFVTFLERNGIRLKITVSSSPTSTPIDLGSYTREELEKKDSNAQKAIIVKLVELTRRASKGKKTPKN